MNSKVKVIQRKSENNMKDLKYCLRDFLNNTSISPNDVFLNEEMIEFSEDLAPPTYMVFLTFVGLLGYRYWGKEEKVAWTIPIIYKGIPFLLSSRKFGFRVLTLKGISPNSSLINEMLLKLKKGIIIADRYLQPIFRAKLQKGLITIANSYLKLTNMYLYFRERASLSYNKKLAKKSRKDSDNKLPKNIVDDLNLLNEYEHQGFYYSVSMMDAYFSRLEHFLVIAVPFSAREISVPKYISLFWKEKYKTLFNLAEDKEALRQYERLNEIKEKYRNPFSHGFFQKDNASLFVHVPVVGAVPLNLACFSGNIHFSIVPISKEIFEYFCGVFDEFEEFLKKSSLRYALKYAETGLDVAFDSKSLDQCKKACESEKEFEEFIEKRAYLSDMYANMDW
jgi:hypothetical protein